MGDFGQALSDSLSGLSSGSGGTGTPGAGTGGDIFSALANAFTPAAGAAPSTTIDPTGTIGAQLAINPPTAPADQGAVGGTQSGGAPAPQQQGQGGQAQSQDQTQGGQQKQDQSGVQQLKKVIQAMLVGRQNAYELGANQQQPPMPTPRWSGEGVGTQPEYKPAPGEAGGSNQREYGPGKSEGAPYPEGPSYQPEYGPGKVEPPQGYPYEGASNQPEYGPGGKGLPVPTQQPAPEAPPAAGGGLPAVITPPLTGEVEGGGGLPATLGGGGLPLGNLAGAAARGAGLSSGIAGAIPLIMGATPTQRTEPGVTPSEAGLAPPGMGQGSYPPSTGYAPGGLPPGGKAPPADPKTGLPSDPVTGKPVTPEEYRKWYNDQTKAAKKSVDPALEPTKKAKPPAKTPAPAAKTPPAVYPPQRPPMGQQPPPGLGGLMRIALPALAGAALMAGLGGLGGRRGARHGWNPNWRRGNMGNFNPHFYPPAGGGGGGNLGLLGLAGLGGLGGGGQGQPAPTMRPGPFVGGGGSSGGAGATGSWEAPDPPGDPNGAVDQNPFMNTVALIESGNRNDNPGDKGLARGYWNIQTPTWRDFAPKLGVDINKWQTADMAPREVQAAVAASIPFYRWGPETQRKLIWKYGPMDQNATLGQLAQRYGGVGTQTAAPSKVYLPPVQPDATTTVAYNP